MRPLAILVCLLTLSACAGYSGGSLVAGSAGLEDVTRTMGTPALQWRLADGSTQLAFPRGPNGVHTYMARFGPDGKLKSIENVLTPRVFSDVRAGMTGEEVLRLLGPSEPAWTARFAARNELVWEWRYCDEWNQLARFDVLFDATTTIVRSTMSLREEQIGACGGENGGCWCSH